MFVEGWEIECCGTPPVVGDDTTWMRAFAETDAEPGTVLPAGARWDPGSRILTAGGVDAHWPAPKTTPPACARGCFSGTRHGGIVPDGTPPTTGRVLGLQLESRKYRLADRMWQPVPGTRMLRRIDRSPTWFAREFDTTGRVETGVLMQVAVPR